MDTPPSNWADAGAIIANPKVTLSKININCCILLFLIKLYEKYGRIVISTKLFRVEPPVTQTAPPQTRKSAINAPGSSDYGFVT